MEKRRMCQKTERGPYGVDWIKVTIDYLKIDIESWEWESMDTALNDGSLKKVKQIGIEFHRTGSITKSYYLEKLNFFSRLHNAGFRKWHTHLNAEASRLACKAKQQFRKLFPKDYVTVSRCYQVI
ncbi:hypothetical protein HELRODRAFT_167613 [Helobdella robusta]|uniref:Methyltransferase domain-containing protein n=1 Tax=Helobdella robusta TaxID=6412 RepID=T1EZK2_HELRO|nr:hypothetical protein HELRODRAFT_167613 [Helobdella robusta]ESO11082.1 hypothetical protein HELRODRAFT_167613 [Helobdella robusta]